MEISTALPPGWQSYTTGDGAVYYHHAGLSITQWEKPLKSGQVSPLSAEQTVHVGKSTLPEFSSASTSTPSFLAGPMIPHQDLESQTGGDLAFAALTEYQSQAQRYFNVTTEEIKERLLLASLPYRMLSESDQISRGTVFCEKPDLYGPSWICITVAFALFAGGHLYAWASQINYAAEYSTFFVSIIVTSLWLVLTPLAVRMTSIAYSSNPDLFRYDQIACVYGYSLWPIVPLSLMSGLPSKLLQLIFVLVAFAVSAMFLGINLQRDFLLSGKTAQMALGCVVIGCHLLYFILIPSYFLALPEPIGSAPAA